MRRRQRIVAFLGVLVLAACGGVDEKTLQKWAGSEVGYEKLTKLASDASQKPELRVEAVALLAAGARLHEVRKVARESTDRETFAAAVADRLTSDLESVEPNVQPAVKSALLSILDQLSGTQRKLVQRTVAQWAFASLPDDADTDAIRKRIEGRISVHEIAELGPYGVDAALQLLAHGFGVERLSGYLAEQEDADVAARAVEAFRKLHTIPDIEIPAHHLAKLYALGSPAAALYLLEMYRSDRVPRALRGDAYALAIQLFKDPKVQKQADRLLPGLYEILASGQADDRRLAIHYILRFGGIAELPKVLAGLENDRGFNAEAYDTPRFARDICRDDILRLRGNRVQALTDGLAERPRLAKLLSVVCLKLSRRIDVLPTLQSLLKDETPLSDLLGHEVTVGHLARNAIDGMRAVEGLAQRRDEGKLAEEDFQALRTLYEDDLVHVGEGLDAAIAARRGN